VARALPDELLATPVAGVNLMPGSLADQLGEGASVLVFLRHFGCIFCRETVAELRRVVASDPDFPAVLFFFQGSPTEGRVFLRRYWPEARAVADPEKRFYEAFGVTRGSRLMLLQPSFWQAGRRARAQGHEQGAAMGDVWMMPGVFLVEKGHVIWSHAFRHAGDHPDFARIPELARDPA